MNVNVGLKDGAGVTVGSDLAVFQVRVNVLDQGIVRVTVGEDQLAQRAAPYKRLLLGFNPELQTRVIYN